VRIKEVVVRRLNEINELDDRLNRPRRFSDRLPPRPLPLYFQRAEKALSAAAEIFRAKVKSLVSRWWPGRRTHSEPDPARRFEPFADGRGQEKSRQTPHEPRAFGIRQSLPEIPSNTSRQLRNSVR
jgi:hypothetical protein